MSDLTPKQARFVAEYLIDSNATQAAIRAGYSKKTAGPGGAQLLKNIKVRAAVEAGREKIAKKLEITAEDLLSDVVDIRRLAKTDGVYAAALKANDMLGKSLRDANPFADGPVNINVNDVTPPSPLEDARRTAFLLRSAQRKLEAQGQPDPLH